jgi:hypothetical protein
VGRLPDASWLDRDPGTGVAMVVGRHRLASDVVGELMDDLTIADVRIVVCDLGEMAVSPRAMSEVFAPAARPRSRCEFPAEVGIHFEVAAHAEHVTRRNV